LLHGLQGDGLLLLQVGVIHRDGAEGRAGKGGGARALTLGLPLILQKCVFRHASMSMCVRASCMHVCVCVCLSMCL
jgi:hypothetical protein